FWVTMTHTLRWRHARKVVGLGPLYQGRFRSFPVESDPHFLTVCRYVERNALRAQLVRKGEDWRWGSLAVRSGAQSILQPLLHPWPVDEPTDWLDWINSPQTDAEVQELRAHVRT